MRRLIPLLLLVASCASLPPAPPVAGEWGGTHVGLRLGADSGTLDYDCASGTLHGLSIAPDGTFSAAGTHSPAAGGPERAGHLRPSFRARYSGRIDGDRMTLGAKLENGVELGPFTLRRGAEPTIFRCL